MHGNQPDERDREFLTWIRDDMMLDQVGREAARRSTADSTAIEAIRMNELETIFQTAGASPRFVPRSRWRTIAAGAFAAGMVVAVLVQHLIVARFYESEPVRRIAAGPSTAIKGDIRGLHVDETFGSERREVALVAVFDLSAGDTRLVPVQSAFGLQ